ncbi:MAG TPA: hypothetical protein VF855_12150 [Acidimicrobiales bacterium]
MSDEPTGLADQSNVSQFVSDAYGDANSSMSADDRAQALIDDVNARLNQEGLPGLYWNWNAGAGDSGQFDFRSWTMELDATAFDPARYEGGNEATRAELLDTIYHEARHSEQWFRIARERIGLGQPAADAATTMGIPQWVADLAAQNPILQCDTSQYEAEQWYQSIYGEGADHRHEVLNDADDRYDEYRALPEEADAWSTGDSVTDEYTRADPE